MSQFVKKTLTEKEFNKIVASAALATLAELPPHEFWRYSQGDYPEVFQKLNEAIRPILRELVDVHKPLTTQEKREKLEGYNFFVGDRNPLLNTDYPGKFMVVENLEYWDGQPSKDAAEAGLFCVVGDDLDALMDEALEAIHEEALFEEAE